MLRWMLLLLCTSTTQAYFCRTTTHPSQFVYMKRSRNARLCARSIRFVRRDAAALSEDVVSQFLSEYGDDGTVTEIMERVPSLNARRVFAGVCVHKVAQEVHSMLDYIVNNIHSS